MNQPREATKEERLENVKRWRKKQHLPAVSGKRDFMRKFNPVIVGKEGK